MPFAGYTSVDEEENMYPVLQADRRSISQAWRKGWLDTRTADVSVLQIRIDDPQVAAGTSLLPVNLWEGLELLYRGGTGSAQQDLGLWEKDAAHLHAIRQRFSLKATASTRESCRNPLQPNTR